MLDGKKGSNSKYPYLKADTLFTFTYYFLLCRDNFNLIVHATLALGKGISLLYY